MHSAFTEWRSQSSVHRVAHDRLIHVHFKMKIKECVTLCVLTLLSKSECPMSSACVHCMCLMSQVHCWCSMSKVHVSTGQCPVSLKSSAKFSFIIILLFDVNILIGIFLLIEIIILFLFLYIL